ncbi:MAG: BrnT family toxin [Bacteriovoracaceae bacterium]|nr:BrnT family toxin [Bacteriovoracaceae bacterium]
MFSWDTNKAISNFEKHGISFEEASTVFADSDALDWEDKEHSEHEKRFKRLGKSIMGKILLVIYAPRRLQNDKETIRIISARQASRKERQTYAG